MKRIPAVALLAVDLWAQELVWERIGDPSVVQHGVQQVVELGDLDGDGFNDLLEIVLAVMPSPAPSPQSQLWFLSGRDGHTLRTRLQAEPQMSFVRIAATGDVDRDGVGDYAVLLNDGTWQQRPKTVQVCSGRDDHLIYQVSGPWHDLFGHGIAGDLDLDGDRRPDLVVTAYYENNLQGAAYAYSNQGRLLYRIPGYGPTWSRLFEPIAALGDIDGDGCDDFGIGADDGTGRGAVVVVSGRNGTPIRTCFGELPNDWVGTRSVIGTGDIDLDGVPDLAAGSGGGSFGVRAVARVWSGRTGAALHTWPGPAYGFRMSSRGQDFDLDGIPDVVMSTPGESYPGYGLGTVFVLSGRNGSEIARMRACRCGLSPGAGSDLTAMTRQPGHPFPLFAECEPYFLTGTPGQLSYAGRIAVYRGSPANVRGFGQAGAGTLPRPPLLGIQDRGALGPRLHLSGTPAGAVAVLLVGVSRTSFGGTPLPLPLDALGFPGCQLLTSVDATAFVQTGTVGTATGYGFFDLPIPLAIRTAGAFTLHGQWLVLAPGAVLTGGTSGALLWRH